MKDESLSSKKLTLYRDMNGLTCPTGVFRNENVKEFIKDLKDRINEMDNSSEYEPDVDAKVIIEEIDKLAGKGLGEE